MKARVLAGFEALLSQLTDEDYETVVRMIGMIVTAMATPEGAVVLVADTEGDGTASIVHAGNETRAPILMRAVGDIAAQLYGRPDEATVQ